MMKFISSLVFFVTIIHANSMLINNSNISYKVNNELDYLNIKNFENTTIIKQPNLWNDAEIELNLFSANENKIKLNMLYKGNRYLGYIYTFNIKNNNFRLEEVEMYQLQENIICKMNIKYNSISEINLIETDKCKPLEKMTISLEELLFVSKNNLLHNILTKNEMNFILKTFLLNKKTLTQYNNIAYYLEKAGAYKEAIYLLEKIIEKYPNRTVAYINLGDSYLKDGNKEKAIKNYKTYVKQMKENNKEKKIPKRVLELIDNSKLKNTSKIKPPKKEEKTFFTKLLELFGSSILNKNLTIMQS